VIRKIPDRYIKLKVSRASTFLLTATVSCLLLVPAPALMGKELEDQKWIEVSTANFRIRSTLSKRKTTKLIRDLHLLRTAVPLFTNVKRVDSTIPTNILAIKRAADFETLGINRDYVGWFRSRLRNNTILIRDTPHMDETAVIIHEYVHFLMRNHSGLAYPRWYDEGFAEYLSGMTFSRDSFEVGAAPQQRVYGILDSRWLSPTQLLDPDEYQKLNKGEKQRFYAQSWALVHFLLNRSDRKSKHGEDMRAYLDLVSSGSDEVEAFESAFGIPAKKLPAKLKSYLRYDCCNVAGYRIEQLQSEFAPEVRTLSRAEISLGLGQTALTTGQLDVARRWYEIAAEDETTRPGAEAGLGDLLKFEGDYEAAQPHFETAVALAPDNAYIQLDAGEFWLSRIAATDLQSEKTAYLQRAKRSFVAAWKLNPSMPEIYVMNARAYLIEGSRIDKAIEMFEEAEILYPSNLQIRMELAEAYAMDGRDDDAIRTARQILSWDHGNNRPTKFANALIDRLVGDTAVAGDAMDNTEP